MAAALLCPAVSGAQVADGRTSVVLGRVTDRSNGDAVADASIALEGVDEVRISDANGRFEFPAVPPGDYVLTVISIGYEPMADTLRVPATSQVDMEVELVPTAVELDPLLVVASYSMAGKMAGFHRRRHAAPTGHFLTRADFEERPSASVSQMLRRVPGIRVIPTRRAGMSTGNDIVMRANCRPTIYIDGVRTMPGGLTVDELLAPRDIEGVEVYRGAQAPAEFAPTECGAILFWTRPGGPPEGNLPFWRAVLVAAGFTAVALFLTWVF